MMTDSRLTLLGQLIDVTERQIQAARTLRHGDLDELNALHSDLLFQLTVAMQEPLPMDQVVLDAIREKAPILVDQRAVAPCGFMVSILGGQTPRLWRRRMCTQRVGG